MKLHMVGTANRRISNVEPQNVEGQNTLIRYSTFDAYSPPEEDSLFDIYPSLEDSLFQSFFFLTPDPPPAEHLKP